MITPSGASSPTAVADAPMVRVLVVDDSAYMRFTISRYLNEAPGLVVVGTARDGEEALDLIPKLQPDVITLDVEMPHLDGLTTLREIMQHYPRPVVMLSSLTSEGASETVQALTLGAVDFVPKPQTKANIVSVMDEVITKVRLAAHTRVAPLTKLPSPARPAATPPLPGETVRSPVRYKATRPFTNHDRVVIVGASTGGPRALQAVCQSFPAQLPAAVVIVQHIPAGFTHSLAERLNSLSVLSIKEAEPGDPLEVGRALLAPGGFHMTFDANRRVLLNQNPTVHGVRPAIDVTMASLTQYCGAACVGVVLTGMGHDGTLGSVLIHNAGGRVIAEAESSCVVWGMPRSVAEAGVADEIVPLPEIGGAIARAVQTQTEKK